jgi:adenylosuccinate synthase
MISYLAIKDKTAVTARAGVGPNAGHTVVFKGKTYKLRMLPSAFTSPDCRLLIGPGVLVNPEIFLNEVNALGVKSRVGVDPQCAIIEPKHMEADKKGYLAQKIKSTGSGSGPCNSDRVMRVAKLAKEFPSLKELKVLIFPFSTEPILIVLLKTFVRLLPVQMLALVQQVLMKLLLYSKPITHVLVEVLFMGNFLGKKLNVEDGLKLLQILEENEELHLLILI